MEIKRNKKDNMLYLSSGNKERYWPGFKKLYCQELQDRQNVEAMVRRQIEFMDRMMPQGKIVIEHSENVFCDSQFCVRCANKQYG